MISADITGRATIVGMTVRATMRVRAIMRRIATMRQGDTITITNLKPRFGGVFLLRTMMPEPWM